MPRPIRPFVSGVSQHVYQRGHNGCATFLDGDDFGIFLSLLRGAADETSVQVHGFALMTTHYHFIATPPAESSLPQMMQRASSRYVQYFNGRYNRFGTLWGGRYSAKLLLDERYWLTCLRYVERNPVEAQLVSDAEQYRWCSYRVHALGEPSDWLVEHALYTALGSTPEQRQRAYRAICAAVPEGSDPS